MGEGCKTHAFDCTVDPASPVVAGKSFTFHNWCIGEEGAGFNAGNGYLRGKQRTVQFKKLSETMQLLGHNSVDVLKFDIEGYEEVNRLFLALHDAGYRVVSREMNEVDEKCAEFGLVNDALAVKEGCLYRMPGRWPGSCVHGLSLCTAWRHALDRGIVQRVGARALVQVGRCSYLRLFSGFTL